MKTAKDFMTEDRFWLIIEASERGRHLDVELNKLSEEEIMGYRYWWNHFHKKSYTQGLWAVAYTVLGGCSDDGFDYFRFWLITRGKAVFDEALSNPDSLCDVFETLTDEEEDYPEQEDVAYVPKKVFERKYNKDFYKEEDKYDFGSETYPEINFEWDEDDEETIRAVCPRTFERWWDDDRF